ncbi:glycosyltransferase family 2 protein [Pseudooceanicola sp. CBS1P-1]|uniref:Uncharacterized protein n=1 Tax=Pseudooceanicola albus TaxID=2692189 RepID=A0A6L7G4G1_9RHOB|nr:MULTISPECIES: hypothetical protein [Pseudooceanicola]MBT9384605.1 glycosyltransferase family 2 protein [Pseudooceanicola endophyticus]MXN18306.1 hypothetical protein [Pseudooceanicola albus]
MQFDSTGEFLRRAGATALARGPVAMIFAEDGVELLQTLRHHRRLGFRKILLFAPPGLPVPAAPDLVRVGWSPDPETALTDAVNAVSAAAPPGTWLYYGFNAEFLFFPFCETRSVGELLAFHAEERRDAMLSYVVDLYAGDLAAHPDAVSLRDAHLDRSGYYAQARPDAQGRPLDRQYDFYGGLRWRFEEHVPEGRRRIDRIALFRARPGLHLRTDFTFDAPEYNTYACPWHNNLTACICSFRAAKALKRNPGSRDLVDSFLWYNSAPFEWQSRQLLDLGLMEPGQWF